MEAPAQTTGSKYRPCPVCSALNMSHRLTCYRCRRALPTVCAEADDNRPPGSRLPSLVRLSTPNSRRAPRRDVFIPDAVLDGKGIVRHRVIVRNISIGGMQVHTAIACRAGSEVRILLPIGGQIRAIEGIVRYCKPNQDSRGRTYSVGIEFLSTAPQLHRILDRLS